MKRQRPSDKWLNDGEAELLVNTAAEKVARAPSYEGQFRKALERGFFVEDCDCALRSSIEIARLDLVIPKGG